MTTDKHIEQIQALNLAFAATEEKLVAEIASLRQHDGKIAPQVQAAQQQTEQENAQHAEREHRQHAEQQGLLTGQLKTAQSATEQLRKQHAESEARHGASKDELKAKFDSAMDAHRHRERELMEQLLTNQQQAAKTKEEQALKHLKQEYDFQLRVARLTALSNTEVRRLNKDLADRGRLWGISENLLFCEIGALRAQVDTLKQASEQAEQHHSNTLNAERTERTRMHEVWSALEVQLREEITQSNVANLRLGQILEIARRNLAARQATLTWRTTATLRRLLSIFDFRPSPRLYGSNEGPKPDFLEQQESPPFDIREEISFVRTNLRKPGADIAPAVPAYQTTMANIVSTITKTVRTAKGVGNLHDHQISVSKLIELQMASLHKSMSSSTAASFQELLAYEDQLFITSCYLTLLKREPDINGKNYYLSRLRSGFTKMHIINQIFSSDERKNCEVELPGLNIAIKHFKRSEQIVIGSVFKKMYGIEGNSTIERSQRALENRLHLINLKIDHHSSKIQSEILQLQNIIISSNQLKHVLKSKSQDTPSYNIEPELVKENPNLDKDAMLSSQPFSRLAQVRARSLELRNHLIDEKSITSLKALKLDGHFSGSYSLAAVNRNIVHRLTTDYPDLKLSIFPREGNPTKLIWQTPGGKDEENKLLSFVESTTELPLDQPRTITLYHHYPVVNNVKNRSSFPIALFFWEESRVPKPTIEILNRNYYGVLVTSWFVKKVLIDSGCQLPIEIIILPRVVNSYMSNLNFKERRLARAEAGLNLLHVSSCFPRKGIDALLKAFNIVSTEIIDITLTIKTFENPHNNIKDLIDKFIDPKYRSNIKVIVADYDLEKMTSLYESADVVVLPTRGEGLNMPAIEAGEHAVPLLVTGYGAHTDFAEKSNSFWIDYSFGIAGTHLNSCSSVWVDPDVRGLADNIIAINKDLLSHNSVSVKKGELLQNTVNSSFFSPNSSYSLLKSILRIKHFENDLEIKRGCKPKVSIVTTWGETCGIAEYSQHIAKILLPNVESLEILYSEGRLNSTIYGEGSPVTRIGWVVGRPLDLTDCPPTGDIVWIQHHFAWYELDETLIKTCKALRKAEKMPFITLHTTEPILSFKPLRLNNTCVCLGYFERIFVHTVEDLNNLKQIGVTDNVVLMPQGVCREKRYTIKAVSKKLTIGSFGFLMKHKGVYELIGAFADFVENGQPEARLRLVNAVRNDIDSQVEYERCKARALQLGVSSKLEWFTDFLEIDKINELLSDCDVIVLAYQQTQESSSAAVRTALAACRQVATTPSKIFDEVRDVTLRINGFDSQSIYDFLITLSVGANAKQNEKVFESRKVWLSQNDWEAITIEYLNIFRSCLIDKFFSK